MTCKFVDTAHRRSPLIRGGLEIPIEMKLEIDVSENALLAMNRYQDLVSKHYREPVNGEYEDVTKKILEDLFSEEDDTDLQLDTDDEADENEATHEQLS